MKSWLRIIFIGLAVLLLFFIFLHIFVNLTGRTFLVKKLQETFKREVTIGSLSTSFPLSLHVNDIEAKGLFKIKEVVAAGGVYDIFRKSFKLSLLKIIRPVVTIERNPVKSALEAVVPADKDSEERLETLTKIFTHGEKVNNREKVNNKTVPNLNPVALPQNRFLSARFSIGHLIVSDGTIIFIDRIATDKDITIKVEQLNIKINNLNFKGFGHQITSFTLKGRIPWQEQAEEGKVEAEGWINLMKKDMQANLKIEDIDGVYLYPYYSTWVDLEKARIQKAKLNFISKIDGVDNNVTAHCRLELTDIVRKPLPPEEAQTKASRITNAVLDIFRALNQGKIVLDFTIRTKMDRPEFGFSNIKMAFEDKLAQGRKGNKLDIEEIMALPVKFIDGIFKGTASVSKAVIEGTIAIGKELKKAVEDALKKQDKEEQINRLPSPSSALFMLKMNVKQI